MSFIYKNPLTSSQLDASSSVTRDKVFGTNFSVLQIGGYMEVYTLADLDFTIPEGDTGLIEFTGNTIPINYSKRALAFLPDTVNLNSDNISTGRRRLGMLVYVHETNLTYQYTITNYESLWSGASESITESDYGTTVTTSTTGGAALIDAWLDSSIEGVSGVTRSNARWRIFYGTDITVTGGTYNSGTGTLTMTNTTGGTFNVTGFTTGGGSDTYVTGGTFSSDTLTLDRNDGNNVNVTGFTSINTNIANSNLTLDQSRTLSLNANDLRFIGGSAETLQFTSSDLILSAATGGGTISFKGISSSSENRVLVINTNGVLSYNDNIQGDTAISALTYNSEWGVTKELTDGTSGTTQLPFITGGTFDGSNINLNIAGGLEPTISISGPESSDVYVTGGTYNNTTGTLTLERNDTNTFNITGFTTGSTGSQNIQQVLDNGNVSTTGMYISGATLSATTVDIDGGTINNTAIVGGSLNNAPIGNATPSTGVFSSATIQGGTINNTVIGNVTPSTGVFSNATIQGGTINNTIIGNVTPSTGVFSSATIQGGTINNTIIGNVTPATGAFSSVTIQGGSINNTSIGLTTRGSAGFTYIFDNNGSTGTTGQVLSTTTTGITWIDSSSTDYYVTGGTYDNSTGTLTLSRNDANTFNITGFTTGTTEDTYVTGTSYNQLNKTLTIGLNDGVEFTATGFSPTITGGTYSSGEISLDNNDGTSTTIGGLEILTHIGYSATTSVSTSGQTIDTVDTSTYQGAFFDYVINDGTNYRAGTVQSVWDGTSISYNDFSTVDIGNTVNFTWAMELSGGDALLKANIAGGTWNIRIIKHII